MTEEAKEALEPEAVAEATAGTEEPSEAESTPLLTPDRVALLRRALPIAWLLAAAVAWWLTGPQLAFLTAAAGVLVLVITLMWSSVQSLTGGATIGFEEALSMGAPSKVEEEKRAVLRALKDLDYERSVGKISPEDYAELSARYRAEAKRLIQSVDDTLGPARREVERAIERRLERAGVMTPLATGAPEPSAEQEPTSEGKPAQPEPPEEQS